MIAVGAALALCAVVGVVAIFSGGGKSTATTPATTATAVATTPAPTAQTAAPTAAPPAAACSGDRRSPAGGTRARSCAGGRPGRRRSRAGGHATGGHRHARRGDQGYTAVEDDPPGQDQAQEALQPRHALIDGTNLMTLSSWKRPLTVAALLVAPVITVPVIAEGAAFAMPAAAGAADVQKAVALFKKASELYGNKKYAPALDHFRQSYALVPSPNSHLYIARCVAFLGDPRSAWLEYDRTIDEAAAGGAKYAADARHRRAGARRSRVQARPGDRRSCRTPIRR